MIPGLQHLLELVDHLPPAAQERVARELVCEAMKELGIDPVVDNAIQFSLNAYLHSLRRPQ